mmetsp:Transcript_34237/g.54884  ORF Transcript_34237/g.54884 Transcript_34237/m.54884 type:complete len:324 (+) Transcript_34237:1286-2257(+)
MSIVMSGIVGFARCVLPIISGSTTARIIERRSVSTLRRLVVIRPVVYLVGVVGVGSIVIICFPLITVPLIGIITASLALFTVAVAVGTSRVRRYIFRGFGAFGDILDAKLRFLRFVIITIIVIIQQAFFVIIVVVPLAVLWHFIAILLHITTAVASSRTTMLVVFSITVIVWRTIFIVLVMLISILIGWWSVAVVMLTHISLRWIKWRVSIRIRFIISTLSSCRMWQWIVIEFRWRWATVIHLSVVNVVVVFIVVIVHCLLVLLLLLLHGQLCKLQLVGIHIIIIVHLRGWRSLWLLWRIATVIARIVSSRFVASSLSLIRCV